MAGGRTVSYSFTAYLSSVRPVASLIVIIVLELGTACGSGKAHDNGTQPPPPDMSAADGGSPTLGGDDARVPDMPPGQMPPFVPAEHPAFPRLVNGRAGVFQNPRIVSIIAQNDMIKAELSSFSEQLINGPWWPAVGQEYGVGNATENLHIIGPMMVANPTRTQMEAYIESVIQKIPAL